MCMWSGGLGVFVWGICVCACPQGPETGFETLGAGVTGTCKLPSVNAIGSKPQPSSTAVSTLNQKLSLQPYKGTQKDMFLCYL